MKKLLIGLSIAGLSGAAAADSHGESPYTPDPGPHAGNWESTLSGSGQSDDSFDNTSFGVTGTLGYYYTKNWLFTVKQSLVTIDSQQNTLINARTVGQVAYQFDYGKWQPYFGVNVGARYGAAIDDDATFGPELGLKYYVNESTFLYGNMAYDVPIDQCCDDGTIPYAVGVGFNF